MSRCNCGNELDTGGYAGLCSTCRLRELQGESAAPSGSGWDGYKHTDKLRFVLRNGQRILQQQWHCIWQGKNGEIYPDQWRDVPLETESQNAEGESRAASARTLHPLVGSLNQEGKA